MTAGIPPEILLFALVMLGVATLHRRTIEVAPVGATPRKGAAATAPAAAAAPTR